MPVAFPPPVRGWPGIQARNLYKPPAGFVAVPNTANPGYPFSAATLDGGRGKVAPRPRNMDNPGMPFSSVKWPVQTVAQPFTEPRRALELRGTLNMVLSGVSRDSTGATLGNCQVLVFRNEDRSLVAETTSDASGNWSVSLLKGGPFFLVEYKAGSPDVFGTSPNNLTAAVVP